MVEIIKAVLFGMLEGVTEWLPISSTGHLILLNEFIKLDVSREFYEMFQVVIQLGAIMAVVVLFFNKIFPFKLISPDNSQNKSSKSKISVDKDIMVLWCKIIVSCLPAAVVGVLFDDIFERYFYNHICVSIALIFFGVAFVVIEKVNRNTAKEKIDSLKMISFKMAIIIGLFQLIAAIFPGTSRSGATILGALLIGVSRVIAAEYTFYLAIPVMVGASLLKIIKFGFNFSAHEGIILAIGVITAFMTSILVIRFLMKFIKNHDFTGFGVYRIVLGAAVIIYFIMENFVFS